MSEGENATENPTIFEGAGIKVKQKALPYLAAGLLLGGGGGTTVTSMLDFFNAKAFVSENAAELAHIDELEAHILALEGQNALLMELLQRQAQGDMMIMEELEPGEIPVNAWDLVE